MIYLSKNILRKLELDLIYEEIRGGGTGVGIGLAERFGEIGA